MSTPQDVLKAAPSTLQLVKSAIDREDIKRRFKEILGSKAPVFMASLTSLVAGRTDFAGCDPNSIISAAFIAATLDLPINPNLGFAHIIPYNSERGIFAQFQVGYKGYIQLALRSGRYKTINATEIYEGELVKHNRFTGEIEIDMGKRSSDKVIGYGAYFRLLNGFEKSIFMTTEEICAHAERYSRAYKNQRGPWTTDFHSMALKTVLKRLLSKYGILSVEMQRAIEADQAVVENDARLNYVDSTNGDEQQNQMAAEATAALAKQQEEPKAKPLDPAIVKSTKIAKDLTAIIRSAKTKKSLEVVQQQLLRHAETGELIESDFAAVKDALSKAMATMSA